MSDSPLLQVRGLRKFFRTDRGALLGRNPDVVKAVDDVSFEIFAGKTLGLVGESGSGKSTTGYCVIQLLRPTAGEVLFDGRDLTNLGAKELRQARRQFQIVFQDPYSSLDPRMTVSQILTEPLEAHGVGSRRDRRLRVAQLLDMVGLEASHARHYAHEFSGGQRQRIGIARALALEPRLVVCDEPVSALDVSVQAQILNLLKDLQRDLGLTYLFISHDLAVVRAVSDAIAVMQAGRIVEFGPADEVYSRPRSDYARTLLMAVPVPDPRLMRLRKAQRAQLAVGER